MKRNAFAFEPCNGLPRNGRCCSIRSSSFIREPRKEENYLDAGIMGWNNIKTSSGRSRETDGSFGRVFKFITDPWKERGSSSILFPL